MIQLANERRKCKDVKRERSERSEVISTSNAANVIESGEISNSAKNHVYLEEAEGARYSTRWFLPGGWDHLGDEAVLRCCAGL